MTTVKPVSIGENTARGAAAFFEHSRAWAKERFRKEGQLLPIVVLVGHRDPHTCRVHEKQTLSIMGIDPEFMADADSKDRLRVVLWDLAVKAEAYGAAFVHEVWFATNEQRAGLDPGVSLEHVPGRKEAVMVVGQHRALGVETHGWFAGIKRPGRGKPRLSPWLESTAVTGGRFVDLLPNNEYLEKVARAVADLTAQSRTLGLSREKACEIIQRVADRSRTGANHYPPGEYLAQRIRETEW